MWLLRKILFPISLVYGLVVYLRNRFYDWGIFNSKSYKTPIICVGNLSVGGTGKTPMVELLISMLQAKYKVAVLSRGYRRKSKGFVLATVDSTVDQLGDEPFQMHSKFENISMAVDKDRQNGISVLENEIKPEVILLDDAFQHRKVKPNLSILLTAFDELYTSDWYLPTGNLRDNKREAQRADCIIVTKCPTNCTEIERQKIVNHLSPTTHQKVLFSYLKYDTKLHGDGDLNSFNELKNTKITVVTGIAKPQPMLDFLHQNDISFEHVAYNDHHNFTATEIEVLKNKPNVVTTEKDYVRLMGNFKCNYISIEHAFFDTGKDSLRDTLEEFMSQYA
jgi:tetraacyldisaccharide 4'-kinase